jgi:hypothetical protein
MIPLHALGIQGLHLTDMGTKQHIQAVLFNCDASVHSFHIDVQTTIDRSNGTIQC